MSNIEFNDDALRRLMQNTGNQVRDIVNNTARETADDDLEHAVETLHQRLNAVQGLSFDRAWSQNAIETLRRGDPLEIRIQ